MTYDMAHGPRWTVGRFGPIYIKVLIIIIIIMMLHVYPQKDYSRAYGSIFPSPTLLYPNFISIGHT